MNKVQARGGNVMTKIGKRWRRVKTVRKRIKRRIVRFRRTRRLAMRVRVNRRWRTVYKRGSGFRVRYESLGSTKGSQNFVGEETRAKRYSSNCDLQVEFHSFFTVRILAYTFVAIIIIIIIIIIRTFCLDTAEYGDKFVFRVER